MISPSSGVIPIDVSTLFPSRIAAALARQDPAQRLEAAKRGMSDAIRVERVSLRERREARALGRLNKPAPASPDEQ